MPPKIPYKQVKVNLTPDNHAKIQALAQKYDMSIASLFRELSELQHDNVPSRKGGIKSSAKVSSSLLYQLAKIGTNLNQIAKHCNINRAVDRLVLEELVGIREELQVLLSSSPLDNETEEEV